MRREKTCHCAYGKPLVDIGDPPSTSRCCELSKTVPRVMSTGLLSNLDIQNKYKETNIFISMSSANLKGNIRPTKIIGRAKEESILSCLRCVAALI